ncbi:MAG: periplasmic heavy metal sensor [Gemmatimonadales bacterium]
MRKLTLAIALFVLAAPMAHAQHPIFIINGVRVDKCENAKTATGADRIALADLDANLIENIEVIKGAEAVRQYGADATNGVITVTMKKGAVVSPTLCSTPKNPCPVYIVDGKEIGHAPCETPMKPKPAVDPIARYLYAPELVMAHQEAIGLTERQRASIQNIAKDMQSRVVDVQLKLASSSEKLTQLLSATVVDEAAVLQQIDQVLAAEREVKRAQLSLLVRVKNQLTPAQQGMLDTVR